MSSPLSLEINGAAALASPVEYTTSELYNTYANQVIAIHDILEPPAGPPVNSPGNPLANPPVPAVNNLTNLNTAINNLIYLMQKGLPNSDPTKPPQYLTEGQIGSLASLMAALQVVGISQASLNSNSPISLTAAQAAQLQTIVTSSQLLFPMYEQVYTTGTDAAGNTVLTGLASSSVHSLQAQVELEYVKTGNDVISAQLQSLENALNVTKTSVNNLTNIQNLHNNIAVYGRGSFTSVTGFNWQGVNGNVDAFQSSYETAASSFFGQPAAVPGVYDVHASYLQWAIQFDKAGIALTYDNFGDRQFNISPSGPIPPIDAVQRYAIVPFINGQADNGDYGINILAGGRSDFITKDGYNKMVADIKSGKITTLIMFVGLGGPGNPGGRYNYENDWSVFHNLDSEFSMNSGNSIMLMHFNPLHDTNELNFISYFGGSGKDGNGNKIPSAVSVYSQGPTIVPVLPGDNGYSVTDPGSEWINWMLRSIQNGANVTAADNPTPPKQTQYWFNVPNGQPQPPASFFSHYSPAFGPNGSIYPGFQSYLIQPGTASSGRDYIDWMAQMLSVGGNVTNADNSNPPQIWYNVPDGQPGPPQSFFDTYSALGPNYDLRASNGIVRYLIPSSKNVQFKSDLQNLATPLVSTGGNSLQFVRDETELAKLSNGSVYTFDFNGLLKIPPGDPTGQEVAAYFGLTQPAMNDVKNQLVAARAALSAQISALSAIATLAGADPDSSLLLQNLHAVREDLRASFRTSSGEIQTTTSLNSAMSGLKAWLFDNYNKRNTPDAALAGQYQNNITAAITAGQSLNDTQKQQVQRYLYVFEEYYKSASSILQKLSQVIEQVAQAISRG